MDHENEHQKLTEQIDRLKKELDVKNIFLFVFNPGDKTDHVVGCGELDPISTVKMLHALGQLQSRLEQDLYKLAMKHKRDGAHMSN